MVAFKLLYWLFGMPVLVMAGCLIWLFMLCWGVYWVGERI